MPQSDPTPPPVKAIFAIALLAASGCSALAGSDIPLPRPRPEIFVEPRSFAEANAGLFDTTQLTSEPSDCQIRLKAIAEFEPMPRLIGPGACGGSDMVQVAATVRSDGTRIPFRPAPVLRCEMAESLTAWVRDEAVTRIAPLGSPLRAVTTYDDFECRGQNRVLGARLSEHGKGNAVDIRAFVLADGRAILPTDPKVPHEVRASIRESACARFTTVLGPGDPYHEEHIHLDIAERRNGYRICQWDVRDPPPPPAEVASAGVPLPQPRPPIPQAAGVGARKL